MTIAQVEIGEDTLDKVGEVVIKAGENSDMIKANSSRIQEAIEMVRQNSAMIKENNRRIGQAIDELTNVNARLMFSVEIAKERVQKLGECWSKIFLFEKEFFQVMDEFIEFTFSKAVNGGRKKHFIGRSKGNICPLSKSG